MRFGKTTARATPFNPPRGELFCPLQLFAGLAAGVEDVAELEPAVEPAELEESDPLDALAAGAALSDDFEPSPAFASPAPLAAGFAEE